MTAPSVDAPCQPTARPVPDKRRQIFGGARSNTAEPASSSCAKLRRHSTSAALALGHKGGAMGQRGSSPNRGPTEVIRSSEADGDSTRSAISVASCRKACGLLAESGRRTAGAHRSKGSCSTEGGERASSSTT